MQGIDGQTAGRPAEAMRTPDNADKPTGSVAPGGDPASCSDSMHVLGAPGCTSAEAFDPARVRSFELTIAAADRARLPRLAADSDTESTYVPAQLVIDGEDVGMVGVRYKGSYTLHSCIADDFSLTCDKISYKVKFDEFDPDKRWHGLKKINLHAMFADDTKMHEHLAYGLFRAMGVVAPRAAHAQVSINAEAPGLFALTEAPDGRFTADRFAPDGDGNLYKEIWPTTTDPDNYQNALETNKDQPQDHAPFVAFAQALDSSRGTQLTEALRARVDVDYMLRYMAVDRIISNWDGVTTFYCSSEDSTDCGNHNMYWYLDEPGNRFWLVPWDLDNTWSLQTNHESAMPPWNEMPADCNRRVQVDDNWVMPPGCDPLFQALAGQGSAGYRDAFDDMLAGPFNVAALHREIDRIAALIRPAVMADPVLDVQAWEGEVAALKSDVALLREKAELLRDGRAVAPFGLRGSGVNDFEGAANVTVAMGSKLDPNPGTMATRTLNSSAPLRGGADLRTDFVFRTGTDPWTWLNLWIGVDPTTIDLSRVRRVRVTLKADQERTGRLELDSPAYADRYSGIRYGWDITVGPQPTTVTLDIAALAPRDGTELSDNVQRVLERIEGLMLQVNAHGLNSEGFFPAGGSDKGFVQLDDLEFLTN